MQFSRRFLFKALTLGAAGTTIPANAAPAHVGIAAQDATQGALLEAAARAAESFKTLYSAYGNQPKAISKLVNSIDSGRDTTGDNGASCHLKQCREWNEGLVDRIGTDSPSSLRYTARGVLEFYIDGLNNMSQTLAKIHYLRATVDSHDMYNEVRDFTQSVNALEGFSYESALDFIFALDPELRENFEAPKNIAKSYPKANGLIKRYLSNGFSQQSFEKFLNDAEDTIFDVLLPQYQSAWGEIPLINSSLYASSTTTPIVPSEEFIRLRALEHLYVHGGYNKGLDMSLSCHRVEYEDSKKLASISYWENDPRGTRAEYRGLSYRPVGNLRSGWKERGNHPFKIELFHGEPSTQQIQRMQSLIATAKTSLRQQQIVEATSFIAAHPPQDFALPRTAWIEAAESTTRVMDAVSTLRRNFTAMGGIALKNVLDGGESVQGQYRLNLAGGSFYKLEEKLRETFGREVLSIEEAEKGEILLTLKDAELAPVFEQLIEADDNIPKPKA